MERRQELTGNKCVGEKIWFGLFLYFQVISYGHVRMVSSLNHTFFWASLTKRLTSTFVHILSLVTENIPS